MSREPGVSSKYQPKNPVNRFKETGINNFVVPMVVKYGEIGKPYLNTSEGQFVAQHGDTPVTGHEFDWRSAIHAFREAVYMNECALRLWVIPIRHWATITDPTSCPAQHPYRDIKDDEDHVTFTLFERGYAETEYAGYRIYINSANPSLFDIRMYEDDGSYEEVKSCSMDPDSANYFVKKIGETRRWFAVDHLLGTMPVEKTATTAFDHGVEALDGLVKADYIGASSEDGYTGLHNVKKLMNTIDQPEGVVIFHKWASDEDTINQMHDLEDFAYSMAIEPVLSPPLGLTPQKVYDLRYGTGDYSAFESFGNDIGGTILIWPHISPTWLSDTKDVDGNPVYIDIAAKKIGRMAWAAVRAWIHEPAAGFEYGEGLSIAHVEYQTNLDTSKLLDPIGVQVYRADLGYIDGHKTLSEDPDYAAGEHIWRLDNKAIRDYYLNTNKWTHRSVNKRKLRAMERTLKGYWRSIFGQHPEAFTFETVEESVEVDVVGQNNLTSDEWYDGMVYTWWAACWSPAIQRIEHRFGHLHGVAEMIF